MNFSSFVGCLGHSMSFDCLKGKWSQLFSGIVDGFFMGMIPLIIAFMVIPSISLIVLALISSYHVFTTYRDLDTIQSFGYTVFFLGLGYLLVISNWGDLLVTIWKVEDLSVYRKCTYSFVVWMVFSLGAAFFTGLCEIVVWILILFRIFFPIDSNMSVHQWHGLGCQMAAVLIFFGCIVYNAIKRLNAPVNPH